MTFSFTRVRSLPLVLAGLLFLAGCVEPSTVTVGGQRGNDDAAPASSAEQQVDAGDGSTEQQAESSDQDPTAESEELPVEEAEPADPAAEGTGADNSPAEGNEDTEPADAEPADAETGADGTEPEEGDSQPPAIEESVPTIDASVPADLCLETAEAIIANGIGWDMVDLGRPLPESVEYTDSAGDPNQSFLDGILGCTATYEDGATLSILGYSNYNIDTYVGTRVVGLAAGSIPIFTAAEPELVRAVIEYPWAASPTGVAAVEITFSDPGGIESPEINAVEALAANISENVAFEPPEIPGPAYPDWYECSLDRFGTAQGDTVQLATALDQDLGLHADELIDRGFGTSSCSLAEGPGTQVSGGFAVGEVFIALAAYESGRSEFAETVAQVAGSPGVEAGTLEVDGVTYRTFAAEGTLALLIETNGNGVMSIFDPNAGTPAEELEGIMRIMIAQLFAS